MVLIPIHTTKLAGINFEIVIIYEAALMNNQHTLAEECDTAIASKDIQLINDCINKLENNLPAQDDTIKIWKQYFLGNLFAAKSAIDSDVDESSIVSSINYYRSSHELATKYSSPYKLEIQTNMANSLMKFERYIEAISLLTIDFSIIGDSTFVSSLNKAKSLHYLLPYLNDECHKYYYKFEIYKVLKNLQKNIEKTTHINVKKEITAKHTIKFIEEMDLEVKKGKFGIDQALYAPKYNNQAEKKYREWCAENCLFLNNLNDLSKAPIIAQDIIQFPSYTTSIEDGPYFSAAFSSIKRQYCFARFLLYEGITNQNCPKYECKDLYLTYLYDETCYDMATEKIKTAFRIIFSTFDQLTTLLLRYFNSNQCKNPAFKPAIIKKHLIKCHNNNPFIKSLYWLACDLQCNDNKTNLNPDAAKLRQLRNDLEHNWLRIADNDTAWGNKSGHDYAFVISKKELHELSMKTFHMARSSMIYFIFTINYHEKEKAKEKTATTTFQMIEGVVPIWNLE